MEIATLKTLAGKVLNIPDAEFATLFVKKGADDKDELIDNWSDIFIKKDAERIAQMKTAHSTELTAMHDKGHKKGTAESLDTWETGIRAEFNYQGNEKGVELIKAITKTQTGGKPVDVKTSAEYLELEKQLAKKDKEFEKKLKDEVEAVHNEYGKKTMITRVQEKARKSLMDMKPVLGANTTIAETRISNYLKELEQYGFQEIDGNILILKPDGKRLETANGHPYEFDVLVKELSAKHFDFEVQPGRENTGAGKDKDKEKPTGVIVPKNWGEVMEAVARETDPKKIEEIYAAYDAVKAAETK